MTNQNRNLNPTREAVIAMCMWPSEYAAQSGGSMDFWDKLSEARKKRCLLVVEELEKRFLFTERTNP